MIPPDYTDVSQESAREAIANSAMALRELARQLRDGGLVNRSLELIGVASRLERACQRLDERRGADALMLQHLADEYCAFNKYADRVILHNFTGWLVSRLVAVSPTAPPAEHQEDTK